MEKHFSFMILVFFTILSLVAAGSDQNDNKYWDKRRQDALKRSGQAHRQDFFNVTNYVNSRARKMFENEEESSLRRKMGSTKFNSSCEVTNPMDSCWRCDDNWSQNRQHLAKCALGFGKGTDGGSDGKIYVVTDPTDEDVVNPKPGTLRHAVIHEDPLWITFDKDMNISLKRELIMNSKKTIDGRGVHVIIENGPGITIQYVSHIIIHGIEFRSIVPGPNGPVRDSVDHSGQRNKSDGNAISIFGSQKIWIDHCAFSNCNQSFIEIKNVSTAITVSNCRMYNQDQVFEFGAIDHYDPDEIMQVTIAYNYFGEKLNRSMPMCSNGVCHLVSNDYTNWGAYAIGSTSNVTILCQGNRFIAPSDIQAKEVTARINVSVPKSGRWRGERDLFLNGAYFEESGHYLTNNPHKQRKLRAMPGIVASVMARYAGPLKCLPNTPC